ncbi:MAG: LysR family transcriptional regulator [Oscillospiraceae bacterium]|nr:LysR family transcriptional regulator [Oscillospiraceae bacterium]
MNFLWLEYFTAVVEEKSIRGAAARMYVSEQAVSEVLKKLEKELGTQLLQRTRPQTVTPAGTVLYRYAMEILSTKERMVSEITENYADARKHTIRIGVSALGPPDFLPALLERVRNQIPGIRLELVRQSSTEAKEFSGADLYFPLIPRKPG